MSLLHSLCSLNRQSVNYTTFKQCAFKRFNLTNTVCLPSLTQGLPPSAVGDTLQAEATVSLRFYFYDGHKVNYHKSKTSQSLYKGIALFLGHGRSLLPHQSHRLNNHVYTVSDFFIVFRNSVCTRTFNQDYTSNRVCILLRIG